MDLCSSTLYWIHVTTSTGSEKDTRSISFVDINEFLDALNAINEAIQADKCKGVRTEAFG